MDYEKGVEDAFRLGLHEAKKASNKQELQKRLEQILRLAKEKQFDKIQELLKAA
jgi:hypothetical protein